MLCIARCASFANYLYCFHHMSSIPLSTIFKSSHSGIQGCGETSVSGMVADLEQSIAQMKDSVRFWTPDCPTIGVNLNQNAINSPSSQTSQIEEEEEDEEAEANWSDVMSASGGTDTSPDNWQ